MKNKTSKLQSTLCESIRPIGVKIMSVSTEVEENNLKYNALKAKQQALGILSDIMPALTKIGLQLDEVYDLVDNENVQDACSAMEDGISTLKSYLED